MSKNAHLKTNLTLLYAPHATNPRRLMIVPKVMQS